MANFLGNLGAALQGQQNYQTWETQQEQAKLRVEAEKENLAQIKDLAAEAKAERKRKGDVADIDYKTLQAFGQPGIPPPPPSAQPPAPGQASVPMIQPNAQYGQRTIGPGNGLQQLPQGGPPPMPPQGLIPPPPGGGAPMPQGGPPMPQQMPQGPQGQQMPPQGPQGGPQQQPPIPPYRTVQGASTPPQGQQGMLGISRPPQQQAPIPRPNSMDLPGAARYIKEVLHIDDARTAMAALNDLTPYLDNQAKQELAQVKLQLQQTQQQAALQEKYYAIDKASEQKGLSREQQLRIEEDKLDLRKTLGMMGLAIAQQRATAAAVNAGIGPGSTGQVSTGTGKPAGPAPGVEAATWDSLLNGKTPPQRGGMYAAVEKYKEQLAKENNMSTQELVSASADVKTKLMAKRSFEIRAQNMERAENQILSEIPLAEKAISGLNLSSIPAFQKTGLAGLRALGDPRVARLDQSLTTIFNEFEGIRTGNPGALHVADIENARHDIENARTEKQLTAAIAGIRATMDRAQAAMKKTREGTMSDINNAFKKEKPAATNAPALPAGWSVTVN